MTAALALTPGAPAPAGHCSLHETIVALLRPQFACDVIIVPPDDPVLGMQLCQVTGCGRTGTVRTLCSAHYQRWKTECRGSLGGPGSEHAWARTADPMTKGRKALGKCKIDGCRRGRAEQGLCGGHAAQWRRAGKPEVTAWVAAQPLCVDTRHPDCTMPACPLAAESAARQYCHAHESRWRQLGKPSHADFLMRVQIYGEAVFDVRLLPPVLQAEMQYAIQQRVDRRTTRAIPKQIAPAFRTLIRLGVTSLLDMPIDELIAQFPATEQRSVPASFVRFAARCVADVQEGTGWDSEFGRDVWQLRRLPGIRPGGIANLRFGAIEAQWLRLLTKRWARLRLGAGLARGTIAADIAAVVSFSQTLERHHPHSTSAAAITRALLETWMAETGADAPVRRGKHIIAFGGFLRSVQQYSWAPELPAEAQIYNEDHLRRDVPLPRFVPETVMMQLDSPQALALLTDPIDRMLTRVIIGTGLRVGDASALLLESLVRDNNGAAYLHYVNRKMRREAFVPLEEDLAVDLDEHRRAVLADCPTATRMFPRRTANPFRTEPISVSAYYHHLNRWFLTCDLRDDLGRPTRITPHQWRHTYATRLINKDVPLEIIRQLLDHSSISMTSRYAKITNQTVRAHWERATKVNSQGEPVVLQPDSPLADAEWMAHNLSRATQALPNGYCGLPIQRSCPHANACLDCPVFVTTPQFLGAHIAHRDTTRQLIATAAANGQSRMVEMNERVERNLTRVIDALQAADTPDDAVKQSTPTTESRSIA